SSRQELAGGPFHAGWSVALAGPARATCFARVARTVGGDASSFVARRCSDGAVRNWVCAFASREARRRTTAIHALDRDTSLSHAARNVALCSCRAGCVTGGDDTGWLQLRHCNRRTSSRALELLVQKGRGELGSLGLQHPGPRAVGDGDFYRRAFVSGAVRLVFPAECACGSVPLGLAASLIGGAGAGFRPAAYSRTGARKAGSSL